MDVDNVFASLGFDPDEATIMALRSDVARLIRSATDGLKQRDAARKLKIAQGDLSKIRNGLIDGISLEFLIRLCVRLGINCNAQWGKSPDFALATVLAEPRMISSPWEESIAAVLAGVPREDSVESNVQRFSIPEALASNDPQWSELEIVERRRRA